MPRDRRPVDVRVNGAIRRRFHPDISDVRQLVKMYRQSKKAGEALEELVKDLKSSIVVLRVQVAKAHVPKGHCPYAYYSIGEARRDCNDEMGCTQCQILFWGEYAKQQTERVFGENDTQEE